MSGYYITKKIFDDKILLNKSIAENLNSSETCEVKGVLYIEHDGSEYVISRKENYTGTNSGYVRASASIAKIEKLQADGQTKILIDTSSIKISKEFYLETYRTISFWGRASRCN